MKKYIFRPLSFFLLILLLLPVQKTFAEYNIEEFTPWYGFSAISEDSTSRFTKQYVWWEEGRMEAYDSWNDTYEIETVFYNYDGGAYATEPYSDSAWGGTFPDAYLDTQALDGDNEYNIAVGSFDPDTFETGKWVYAWVRTDTTESPESFYKINSQKGYSTCEIGAWCVNNEQTARGIPFKSPFTAPESRYYKFEWSNYNFATADYTPLGYWMSGALGTRSEKDYYYFNVPSSQTVDFVLKIPTGPLHDDIDYNIRIYDENENLVTYSFSGRGEDEIFSKYLTSGKYYAKIYAWQPTVTREHTYSFIAY